MPFVKRLRRIGTSVGLIIDRPLLELLDLGPDDEVEVSVEHQALVIRPHRAPARARATARPARPTRRARRP